MFENVSFYVNFRQDRSEEWNNRELIRSTHENSLACLQDGFTTKSKTTRSQQKTENPFCVCGKCPTLKTDDGFVQDFEVVTLRKGAKTVLRHINGHDNAKILKTSGS